MFDTRSEMDVSRVDPEEVLVNYQTETVEAGDLSADIDLESLARDYGKEDKVLVSIRCVCPTYVTQRCATWHKLRPTKTLSEGSVCMPVLLSFVILSHIVHYYASRLVDMSLTLYC